MDPVRCKEWNKEKALLKKNTRLHSLLRYQKVPQGTGPDQDPCSHFLEIVETFEKSWISRASSVKEKWHINHTVDSRVSQSHRYIADTLSKRDCRPCIKWGTRSLNLLKDKPKVIIQQAVKRVLWVCQEQPYPSKLLLNKMICQVAASYVKE